MKMIFFVISLIFSGKSIANTNTIPYPPKAEMLRITGYVEITYYIDNSGRVANLIVTDSYPYGVFEKAVKKSSKNWILDRNNPRKVVNQRVVFN